MVKGKIISVLQGHLGPVTSVAFSPDEKQLASASSDRTVRLWDGNSGESIESPFKHSTRVYSVIFTPDGSQIISGTTEGLVYIWDRRTGECQHKLTSYISTVFSLATSPLCDRLVAIGWRGVCIWSKNKESFEFDDELSLKLGEYEMFDFRGVFTPDGQSIVVCHPGTSDDAPSGIFPYNLRSRVKVPIVVSTDISGFSISPDGSSVSFGDGKRIATSLVPQLLPLTLASLSPDGDMVACAFQNGTVWLGSPKELPAVKVQLEGKVGNISHLTFTSDNALLAAVDSDSIYLWEVSTQKFCGCATSTNLTQVASLSFQSDRSTIVTTHEDQSMYAWSMVNGTLNPLRMDPSSFSDVDFDSQLVMDVDEDSMCEIAGARWFTQKKGGSGFWAYVDGNLIRAREDGSVTLLPLGLDSASSS